MKILFFTCDYKPMLGGIAEYTHNIALEMSRRHEVIVLAPHVEGCERFDKEQPFRTIRYRNTMLKNHLLSITDLWRLVRKERPDVIFNAMYYPAGLLSYWVSRFTKTPYTVSAHAVEVLETDSTAAQRLKRCLRRLRVAIHNNALVTFAVSNYTRKKLLAVGVKPSKVVFVPNGVHPGRFRLVKPKKLFSKERITLLTLARIVDYKGQDMAIRALPAVLKRHSNVDYVIVGKGPYEQALRALVKELELEDHVKFLGVVDDKKRLQCYDSCDIFIMCSRAYEQRPDVEGFGISFVEAHAFRKPVIGGNSGGIPDAVHAGKTGLLVNPEDPKDIAKAINRLIENPALARKLGEQGYARIESELNWQHLVKQMEKIIEERA
jgi:phosphatidyl-myo-inositol dimannoside synthase